jgi:hypothetical protein
MEPQMTEPSTSRKVGDMVELGIGAQWSPLTLDEIKDIRTTLLAMETEIHNPGTARARRHDLMADIEDVLYRLADVIERTARLATEAA